MEFLEHEHHYWLIEPLLAVGVPLDEIRTLVFRLAFEGVVGGDPCVGPCADRIIGDQAPPVRAAWQQVIERMLVVGEQTVPADAAG